MGVLVIRALLFGVCTFTTVPNFFATPKWVVKNIVDGKNPA